MLLSQYLKVNALTLGNITGFTVCIFVLLQLAVWYPLLSDTHNDMSRHLKRKGQVETKWQQIQGQVNRLKEAAFINETWVNHGVISEKAVVPTQWFIEGSALLAEWQTLLEKVEEQVALGLQSVYWQSLPSGKWRGRLLFYIKAPSKNRSYHNWLPTKLRDNHFVEKDWRILSTMKTGENTSALLEYKQQRYWVRQGSWLPAVGLMVDTVAFDQVTLLTKAGAQITLTSREKGDADADD